MSTFKRAVKHEAQALDIERMCLRGILDDIPFCSQDNPPKFTCRVVFRFLSDSGIWYSSCRGKNWMGSGKDHRTFATEEQAIKWLKEETHSVAGSKGHHLLSRWSQEDNGYIGTSTEFPMLTCRETSVEGSLNVIRELVKKAMKDSEVRL